MDDTGDGRWLSYAELAAIRGTNRKSAVKLVQRERWPRSSGNDRAKTVRVLVPEDWLQPAKERPPSSRDQMGGSGEYTGMLAAIEAAHAGEVAALRGEIAALKALAEATNNKLTDLSERAERAEAKAANLEADMLAKDAQLAQQRIAIEQARTEAQEQTAGLRRDLDAAQRDAQAVQAELAAAAGRRGCGPRRSPASPRPGRSPACRHGRTEGRTGE